ARDHVAAPRHRELSHAAQPARAPARAARGPHRRASGVSDRLPPGRLVALAGQRQPGRARVQQVPGRPRAPCAGRFRHGTGDAVIQGLRSLVFNVLGALWLFGLGIVALPMLLLPRRWVWMVVRLWARGVLAMARVIVGLDYTVRGLAVPVRGPMVL